MLVEDLRKKNKVGLAATIANGDFRFVDPTIRFSVANDVQFEEMKECSTELLHFIRTEVGNGAIALEVQDVRSGGAGGIHDAQGPVCEVGV